MLRLGLAPPPGRVAVDADRIVYTRPGVGSIRGTGSAVAGKKAPDVEKAVSLFPRGSAKALQRLLKRAQDKAARTAQREVAKALRGASKGGRLGSRIGSRLAGELAKAVSQRGAPRKEAPSIRQKASAAQGGGKPFHFAHSVVTKADPTAPATSRASKGGKAAAHMRYIERETAVEAPARGGPEVAALAEDLARSLDREGAARDDGSRDRGPGEGREAGPGMGSAAAAQGYVENPVKLANGEHVVFSFGNIGDAFEDRVRFWSALEEAEAHPNARVQHRLIVELPHEATPEARFEIVKTFARKFEDDGVPFWAALHAPGKDNDSRNFHAHIVYSERPAKRMVDEADGAVKWDFEVRRVHVKSSRNRITKKPFRQNKLREYTDRKFILALRKHYAEVANKVLARDDVKDAAASPVRYDHRSYKDMGVDATPMRSVNRIVADRLKDGRATVLDGDYTHKLVAAEIQAAARARNKTVLELIALDKALQDVAREPAKATTVNPRLPKELRVSPLALVSHAVLAAASKRLMEARHAAVRLDVMEKATAASLTRIVEATDPKAVAAAAKAKDPLVRAAAPDPVVAALLHEAAKEELAETRAQAAKERRTLAYRTAAAVGAWQAAVAPFRTESTPSAKMAMRMARERQPRAAEGRSAEPPPPRAPETPRAAPAREAAVVQPPGPDAARRSGPEAPKAPPGDPSTIPAADLATAAKMLADALARRTAERAAAIAARDGAVPAVTPPSAERRAGRVPTLLEAQAASLGVSMFLKRIRDTTSTLEERVAILQNWTDKPILKTPTQAAAERGAGDVGRTGPAPGDSGRTGSAGQPGPPPSSATPEAPRTEGVANLGVGPGEGAPPATPPATPRPEQADLWPAEAAAAKGSERAGRTGRRTVGAAGPTVGEPTEMGPLGVGRLASSPATRAGGDGAAPPEPAPSTVPPPAPVAEPADAGRGRKRTPEEEELERRRKQRKAVLAKSRKRGRTR